MARTRASDFEEKQHGILMSAAAVFAEQGMDKASMAQIASHSQRLQGAALPLLSEQGLR